MSKRFQAYVPSTEADGIVGYAAGVKDGRRLTAVWRVGDTVYARDPDMAGKVYHVRYQSQSSAAAAAKTLSDSLINDCDHDAIRQWYLDS